MYARRQALTLIASLAALATLAATAGCATTPAPATLTETLGRNASTQTLARLVKDAGLGETLASAGPYTVFAPSDAAFKAVPAKTLAELAANKEQLKAVLSYHVVAGNSPAAAIKQGNVKTVNGANLALAKSGGFITVEDAVVEQADIKASNGVVHLVDRVLMPPKK
ncbi:Fasciclin domain-containing protein [Rubrivivax sp. A210]|uniref:fasciclin domain-containing protein n=1 Tax=Rubrivivax sp. A210 TaxID=2772301 RepID=UPI00191B7AD5|nr:fasciclin domain-containing protein [Rubrivivax sp. A210]CAD5373947.1 Fasciclin domain-containing protein [Rubrivivax sp. A210]